jgi:hypothetical protein
MNRPLLVLVLCALTSSAWAQSPRAAERAVVPLSLWQGLRAALNRPTRSPTPPEAWAGLGRRIEGGFERGLLEATLSLRFEVLDTSGWTEVPVLDARASLVEATLDGGRAALRRDGDLYVLGVAEPGPHRLTVRFLLGQAEDRFARALDLKLPPGGPTVVALTIPEPDIEAKLAQGVLTGQRAVEGGTLLEGAVDGASGLHLSWKSRDPARAAVSARMSSRLATLYTVQSALVTGVAHLHVDVAEGEVDRLDLPLPEGVEVVRVEGASVLQWKAEAGVLRLLLTHLVQDEAQLAVHFQLPVAQAGEVLLRGPRPPAESGDDGVAGVVAPAGLELAVLSHPGAQMLDQRDLPAELLDLTDSPLLFGFRHAGEAKVRLGLSRNDQVELTGTVVDEIEASTLLLEDGAEITKVKLHLRNNTRQHLGLVLPEGARLTHALIDGRPVHPAHEDGRLLFPLRQSERLDGEGRHHQVRAGENLGRIAYTYYSNPDRWPLILAANEDTLGGDTELYEGLRLIIPPLPGAQVEESRFVLELAFERAHAALGVWGSAGLSLPTLEVEAVKATWHVYLPEAVDPLRFEGNLSQYSAIRYDPFRRARDFLRAALVSTAEAGGYKNILLRRKGIYLADAAAARGAGAALGSFPLVGRRYRFKRLIMGAEAPSVEITYLARRVSSPLRWGALGLAALLALLAGARGRRPLVRLGLAAALALPLLVLGHYLLGVNRHLVWGADLGLLVLLGRHHLVGLRAHRPPDLLGLVTLGNLLLAVGTLALVTTAASLPLLAPIATLAVLAGLWSAARLREATHA